MGLHSGNILMHLSKLGTPDSGLVRHLTIRHGPNTGFSNRWGAKVGAAIDFSYNVFFVEVNGK